MIRMKKYRKPLLFVVVVLFWFAQYVYIPQQTPFLMATGVGAGMVGNIIGAYGISQMLLRLPVGIMADRAGHHKLFICLGVLGAGLASTVRILWPGGPGFFIANLFSGFASAMWISFMVLYMDYGEEGEQQKSTSQVIMANNLGILLGFGASTLFYERMGMSAICAMSVGAGVLGLLLALGIPAEKESAVMQSPAVKDLLAVCKSRKLWLFSGLAIVQQGIQMSTTMSFTAQILKGLGANAALIGLSSIIYMVCAVCFAYLAGTRFCGKRGPGFWVPTVLGLVAVYCVAVSTLQWIPAVMACQILPGASTGILFTYLTSEAMDGVPREKKSTAMGFYQAVYALGMTILPMLSGYFAEHFSMRTAYFILAAVALAGCAFSVVYYQKAVDSHKAHSV